MWWKRMRDSGIAFWVGLRRIRSGSGFVGVGVLARSAELRFWDNVLGRLDSFGSAILVSFASLLWFRLGYWVWIAMVEGFLDLDGVDENMRSFLVLFGHFMLGLVNAWVVEKESRLIWTLNGSIFVLAIQKLNFAFFVILNFYSRLWCGPIVICNVIFLFICDCSRLIICFSLSLTFLNMRYC